MSMCELETLKTNIERINGMSRHMLSGNNLPCTGRVLGIHPEGLTNSLHDKNSHCSQFSSLRHACLASNVYNPESEFAILKHYGYIVPSLHNCGYNYINHFSGALAYI